MLTCDKSSASITVINYYTLADEDEADVSLLNISHTFFTIEELEVLSLCEVSCEYVSPTPNV